MEITDLKQMTKEEVFKFIRQRLSFSKELKEQFRHVNKNDLAKEHRRFEMSGNESKTGQCTIFNTAILNEFADLGIYDYTSYLFLDFHNGTPTVYLKYFSENENLEYSFTGYTTTEMPNYHSILEQYGVSIEKALFWKVTTIIMFPEILFIWCRRSSPAMLPEAFPAQTAMC